MKRRLERSESKSIIPPSYITNHFPLVASLLASPFILSLFVDSLALVLADKFAPVCVLVDKLEKVPISAISVDLAELDISEEVIEKLLEVLGSKDIQEVEKYVGSDSPAVKDLKRLLALLEAYGVSDWFLFDASVVRGLSYYTGVVFEAFDRRGELRAIAGGGEVRRSSGNLRR